jgi:hypothetical protein
MNIKTTLAGALALLIPAVPSLAFAQQSGYPYARDYDEPPYATPAASVTPLNIVPPAYGSVYVYEGHRLLARFDGPGSVWVPSGGVYRVVAMRGEQMIWSGNAATTGVPVELRWPVPRTGCPTPYSPYALRPRTPIEQGRIRTPLP